MLLCIHKSIYQSRLVVNNMERNRQILLLLRRIIIIFLLCAFAIQSNAQNSCKDMNVDNFVASSLTCLKGIEEKSPFNDGEYVATLYNVDKILKKYNHIVLRDSLVWHGCKTLMRKAGTNTPAVRKLFVTMVEIKNDLHQYDLMEKFASIALRLFYDAKDFGIDYVLLSLQSANGYKHMSLYAEMKDCIEIAKCAYNKLSTKEREKEWLVGIDIELLYAKYYLNTKDYTNASFILEGLLEENRLDHNTSLYRTIINDLVVAYTKSGNKAKAWNILENIKQLKSNNIQFLTNYISLAAELSQTTKAQLELPRYNKMAKKILSEIIASYNEQSSYAAYNNISQQCMLCNNECATKSERNDTIIKEAFSTLCFLNDLRLSSYQKNYTPIAASIDKQIEEFGADAAYILFSFRPNRTLENQNTVPDFMAYVLRGDTKEINVVNIANVETLESLFLPNVGEEFSPIDYSSVYNSERSDTIYFYIWHKIASLVKGCKTIYYTPAGGLAYLNIDMIVNRYDSNVELRRVSSFTDAIESNFTSRNYQSICLFGDIDYGVVHQTKCNNWKRLPSTTKEIYSIKSGCKSLLLKCYMQANATEEVFKSLSGQSPSIIHIATHGYEMVYKNNFTNPFLNKQIDKSISFVTDCNILSGLIFAKGNIAWNGLECPPKTEDGILTADEIARLDLSNTDLVVLSACETARGYIDPIEGVWGLQRAFKQAGVKTILMTLWKVSDDITAMFMELFYKNLFEGNSARQSVKNAQKHLVDNGIVEPYYWAPFIVLD